MTGLTEVTGTTEITDEWVRDGSCVPETGHSVCVGGAGGVQEEEGGAPP